MLPRLAIIIAVLAILFLAVRWFTRANPASVSRGLKLTGLAGLVMLGLWLVLTGKLAGLFAVAAGLFPWIIRALRLHGLWKVLQQFANQMRGGQASAGNTSQVRTRFLDMTLDHDSGALGGRVIEGRFRGKDLSELDFAQALGLWHDVQSDNQSAQVLEAWLDRTWPDWRDTAGPSDDKADGGRDEQGARPSAAMSRDEAFEILGLAPGASAAEIKAAHRRLMRQVHPDHGGSTWVAARINQARDLLLG